MIRIKIRRHDRSHLRVDTWEEDRRKVESSMLSVSNFNQSISHHLSVSPFSSLVLDLVDSTW